MERILIYKTLFKELATGTICCYVGSHRTKDMKWPQPGCKDNYIGSCGVVMSKRHGRAGSTVEELKDGWEWISTTLLHKCLPEEGATLAVEGAWILKIMKECGIHPLAKQIIRVKSEIHPLLTIKNGTCLNCHINSQKFLNTEYYNNWLLGQGERSKLGNTIEARKKAKATREAHRDALAKDQSERMGEYVKTQRGKEFIRMLSASGNTPEARAKCRDTRLKNMDQWVCENCDVGEGPLRHVSMRLGLGRGAQQCWSRLGKPDIFEFKGYKFKLVRRKKASCAE